MARRGDVLREHILENAKEAFLRAGFERTSMDAVASQAQTSKRSLYAHFPTKEALFLAVVDHIDQRFQNRMLTPADYADDPAEAAAQYCARFVQMLRWESVVQTCRLGITTAVQFPAAAARLHEVFFDTPTRRLAAHFAERCQLDDATAEALATDLIGATTYPELPRLLFGIGKTRPDVPEGGPAADDVDLPHIRLCVRRHIAAVQATPTG